ncbi:uncharacterized protein TrAtP1_008137 [Trichoderma atroviride]|uniref:uncharacterized protein n=1 Tax=Hypocrea atroviridis TaxID=63577 RepID=UPI00331C7C73|nr:hypothetical protein TrAtP1_008137 [Trichoderma atroviride]
MRKENVRDKDKWQEQSMSNRKSFYCRTSTAAPAAARVQERSSGCVDSPQTFRSAVASAPCSHQFAAPLPSSHRKTTSSTAKNSPGHPQSTEPQQGTRASHSVARHAQHRGSTPKTVQNIRPAAAREKSDQIGSLAPPQLRL